MINKINVDGVDHDIISEPAEKKIAENKEKLDTLVVNDLTTGGADKALSAEMGKELAKELTELESELQNSLYEITPKAFTESEKDALEAQGLWEAELNKYPLVYVLEN